VSEGEGIKRRGDNEERGRRESDGVVTKTDKKEQRINSGKLRYNGDAT
jgi:hypothetical protein